MHAKNIHEFLNTEEQENFAKYLIKCLYVKRDQERYDTTTINAYTLREIRKDMTQPQ